MDNTPRRIPDGTDFHHGGVIVSFMEEQVDEHIFWSDPPGEGPAGSAGECNYNFISVEWTTTHGVTVNTKSFVPVCNLTDERYPACLPGRPDEVLNIIGSTNLTISVPDREPRKLTFLVVAANNDIEIDIVALNYNELGLDPATFGDPLPPAVADSSKSEGGESIEPSDNSTGSLPTFQEPFSSPD